MTGIKKRSHRLKRSRRIGYTEDWKDILGNKEEEKQPTQRPGGLKEQEAMDREAGNKRIGKKKGKRQKN